MANVQRTVTINAPVEKVFSYVEDPMNTPDWLPSMIEVRDVNGSGVGQEYRWTYKMAGVSLQGESTVTEQVANERRVMQSKGGIVSTWRFNLVSLDNGTKLMLDIEYTIPVPVLGKLAEKLVLKRNEREADLAMANLKDNLEG